MSETRFEDVNGFDMRLGDKGQPVNVQLNIMQCTRDIVKVNIILFLKTTSAF